MALLDGNPSRRNQILAATHQALAALPLPNVTTREIARRVGVTQPALFRHFRSRQALFLALIDESRRQLALGVEALLAQQHAPLQTCELLALHLAHHARENPGLPRLLLADVSADMPELLKAIQQLTSMQWNLVHTLVAQGLRQGQVRADCDSEAAATLFISMIQGVILTGTTFPAPMPAAPLEQRLAPVLSLWHHAVASQPVAHLAEAKPLVSAAPSLTSMDARPLLAAGQDPLRTIMQQIDLLAKGSVLAVTAPFAPRPLLTLLAGQGHGVELLQGSDNLWNLLVFIGAQPGYVDLRDFPPPEPMAEVLKRGALLVPGALLLARLPHNPRMLLPHLSQRQHEFTVLELVDGSAILLLHGARRSVAAHGSLIAPDAINKGF